MNAVKHGIYSHSVIKDKPKVRIFKPRRAAAARYTSAAGLILKARFIAALSRRSPEFYRLVVLGGTYWKRRKH
jgi:hypothetical protein